MFERIAVSFSLLTLFSAAYSQSTNLAEPSELEIWVELPGSQITWSKEVADLSSSDAQVAVTAIIVETPVHPPGQVRGVKIGLNNELAADTVYITEDEAKALISKIERLESGFHEMRSFGLAGATTVGLESCWNPQPVVHTICVNYYVHEGIEGITISTFTDVGFRLPDRNPSELSTAMQSAVNQLKDQQ